ncbi:MAG: HD domain-containing protein [Bacillota bacterium]|jgi:putative nucleotidyltransferase with HDIG domain
MQWEAVIEWGKGKMLRSDEAPLEIGYRWHHGRRVANLALELARVEALTVDREVLYIGALLHDVGKAGYQGKEHGPRGARLIEEQIPHLFGRDELRQVTSIVANHYQRPKSKYLRDQPHPGWPPEVLLVQDADTLDHFGANGIWINHHWAALERRNQAESIARYYGVEKAWRQEALQALNYPAAVEELKQRIAFMDSFMRHWQREEQGLLIGFEGKRQSPNGCHPGRSKGL